MTIPGIGEVDMLAVVALGFLAAILGVSIGLFAWLMAPKKKPGG